mmetsp:Transcript_19470/g.41010  ORF Transcript_19470/g.41010 Transcript_19470/m.41010 type:complete len:491 (+) Transcript_19470:243-1715(+)
MDDDSYDYDEEFGFEECDDNSYFQEDDHDFHGRGDSTTYKSSDEDDDESSGSTFDDAIVDFIHGEYDLDSVALPLFPDPMITDGEGGRLPVSSSMEQARRTESALRNMEHDLQEYTRIMRLHCTHNKIRGHSDMNNFIVIKPTTRAGQSWLHHDDEDLKISPDSSMICHWANFSMAMRACDDDTFESCEIYRINLAPEVLNILIPALSLQHIQELSLNDNDLGSIGISAVAAFLKVNRSLEKLDLSNNEMDDLDSVRLLSKAMRNHSRLERLELKRCRIGENSDILRAILQSNVHYVDLDGNGIGSSGAVELSNFIESNESMKSISLSFNKFNDGDAAILSKSLRKNTHMKYMYLWNNAFSSFGTKTMFAAIFDASCMEAMYESNHNCNIHLSQPLNAIHAINRHHSRERNRKVKIFLALRASRLGVFNTSYIDNVPFVMMHYVIFLLQGDVRESMMLTKMFQLVKGWKMQSVLIRKNDKRADVENLKCL